MFFIVIKMSFYVKFNAINESAIEIVIGLIVFELLAKVCDLNNVTMECGFGNFDFFDLIWVLSVLEHKMYHNYVF